MIPSKHRLGRAAFSSLKASNSVFNTLFSIKYTKKSDKISRFSVVVSKKVAKTAVERNTLRRRVYSIVEMSKKPNISAIFYMKQGALNASFSILKAEIISSLEQIK